MENETEKRQYFSDVIGEDYKNWLAGHIILGDAPTGCGKTYFIIHILLPYVHSINGKILYLVNRHSLKLQIEDEISKLNESNKYLATFASTITVDTYQNYEKDLQKTSTYSPLIPFKVTNCKHFIICDEVHYFYCDSLFNTNTYITFYDIISMRLSSTLIFLSATLNNFYEDLINKIDLIVNDLKSQFVRQEKIYPIESDSTIKVWLRYYSAKSSYSNIKLHTINDINDISEKICTFSKDEKFIIFTDNIKVGNSIKRDLDSKLNSNIPFHVSKYHPLFNTKEEIDKIIKHSSFDEHGIIATSTLDNGINLKNHKIQHMFILVTDYEEFLQMLGRKRFEKNESLNLYILKRNCDYYSRKENNLRQFYKLFSSSCNLNDFEIIQNLLNKKVNEFFLAFTFQCSTHYNSLTRELGTFYNDKLQYNSFSVFRIKNLLGYYKQLHQEYIVNQKDPLINHVCEWLHIEPCDVLEYNSKYQNTSAIVNRIINENNLINKELTTSIIDPLFHEYKKIINSFFDSKSRIKSTDPVTTTKFSNFLNMCDDGCMYSAQIINQKKIIISLKDEFQ